MQSWRPFSKARQCVEVYIIGARRACLPVFTVSLLSLSYAFLKYLPNFMNFKGTAHEMIPYLRAQNAQFANDIRN
jgi:hypothetical protein